MGTRSLLPSAPPGARVLAFGVDALVIAAWAAVLGGMVLLVGSLGGVAEGPGSGGGRGLDGWSGGARHALGFVTLTLPAILYLGVLEARGGGATLGKRWLGLRVEGVGRSVAAPPGDPPRLPAALARAALRLLPWEVAHASLWRLPGWPAQVTHLPPGPLAGLVLVWVLVGLYAWTLLTGPDGQALWDRLTGTRVVATPGPRTPRR